MELRTDFDLDMDHPLPGHPNPYWQRDDFISLNGKWNFFLSKEKSVPQHFDQEIVVPFSPETRLSGVGKRIGKDDYLHYQKIVKIDKEHRGKNCLLHFMAVDQECDVYVDDVFLGSHKGGYSSFAFFIKQLPSELKINLVAKDDTDSPIYARGKQSNNPKGIWYTPTSGIWQEVYREVIDEETYLKACKIQGDFENKKIIFKGESVGKIEKCAVSIFYKNSLVRKIELDENLEGEADISNSFHPWSPKEPNLYSITFSSGKDVIRSSFAFRKISRQKVNGFDYLMLNDEPIFLNGLLDQGYFPDGGLTPISLDAMKNDILLAKECGFNCLRKHIKVEPRRWYHFCDEEGIIVIQDLVNGGAQYSKLLINLAPFLPLKISDKNPILGRINDESKKQFLDEMKSTIDDLGNIGSICIWTLFNEGWGQFDTKKCFDSLTSLDNTRLIDATSGWYDKKIGDFYSRHIYFRPVHLHNDKKRIMSLSEYGGYVTYIKDHSWSKKSFGYKNYKNLDDLNDGLNKLFRKEIRRCIKKARLSIAIYTQLNDVEEEVNGLITYDRKIVKVDIKRLKETNELLYEEHKNIYLKDKERNEN